MPDAADRQSLGKQGELLACEALARKGYAVLATRFRTRFGEIDIVARDGPTLVFVEVKARRTDRCGEAAETISWHKRRRIAAMALDYLASTGDLDRLCRFDVVAIDGIGTDKMRLRIIDHAFTVDR
jgi:putative endonuclease